MQFNIWQEGTNVEDGFEAIIDEIIHTESKYPILELTDLFPVKNEHGSITKLSQVFMELKYSNH